MPSRRAKEPLRKNPPRRKPRDNNKQDTKKRLREELSDESESENEKPKSTSKKSKYFPDSDSNSDYNAGNGDALSSTNGDTGDASASEPYPYDSGDLEEEQDEEEERPKTSKKGGSGQAAGRKRKSRNDGDAEASTTKGKLLWKEGVKTGLGPGKEVFIKLPKAREAGDIPYKDDELHPNTILFLKDLKENNEREWLKSVCNMCEAMELVRLLTLSHHGRTRPRLSNLAERLAGIC